MVAGATGAVAVVLPSLVEKHGVGYMFYAIMLAGIIQLVFGLLRLGVLVRMIPHPVMVGFCNGLGVVIGVAQFNIFKIRPEDVLRVLVLVKVLEGNFWRLLGLLSLLPMDGSGLMVSTILYCAILYCTLNCIVLNYCVEYYQSILNCMRF